MAELVSVVTPTRGAERHLSLLQRCLPSVTSQSYSQIEHLVVSGDPDPALGQALASQPGVRHLECPEDHSLPDVGSQARNWGAQHASGEYICYLDDDCAYLPQHVELLAGMLEANPSCDFVYTRFHFYGSSCPVGEKNGTPQAVGATPPIYGHIDCSSIMHRRGFLERFGEWPVPNTYPDAEAATRWTGNGAQWLFTAEVTYDYFYDTPGLRYPGRHRAAGVPE